MMLPRSPWTLSPDFSVVAHIAKTAMYAPPTGFVREGERSLVMRDRDGAQQQDDGDHEHHFEEREARGKGSAFGPESWNVRSVGMTVLPRGCLLHGKPVIRRYWLIVRP